MSTQIFARQLEYGKIAEGKIANWLTSVRSCTIMPVYEVETNSGKCPRVFAPDRTFVAPDIFAFKAAKCFWIESKHKSVFTWHRITQKWVTGIDLRHYRDYQALSARSGWPVFLLFLHENSQPDARDVEYCRGECPTGLFCVKVQQDNPVTGHADNENHRHPNWGRSGMVYWAHETLIKLSEVEDLR